MVAEADGVAAVAAGEFHHRAASSRWGRSTTGGAFATDPDASGICVKVDSSETFGSARGDDVAARLSYTEYACTWLCRAVGKPWFEGLIAVLILANSVTIGFEVENLMGRAQFYLPAKGALDSFFAAVFLAELCLRVAVVGWRSYVPCCGALKRIWVWNLLEAIVVLVSCASAWVPGLGASGEATLQVVTVLRAMRLMRVARIVSRVRFFHEVWILLRGLAGSVRVLFWTVVVVFIVTYIFAVFGVVLLSVEIDAAYADMLSERERAMHNFTEYVDCSKAAESALAWTGDRQDFVKLEMLYRSTQGIWQWIFTLLQVLTMDSWMSIARPMQDVVKYSFVFFYIYIALVVFVLMNLVTAIIVDNALLRSQEDERQIRKQKKREQKKAEKRCRTVFKAIDEDGDENLTLEELKSACADPFLGRHLQVLDITSENADEIFKMMDTSDGPGDGVLSLEDFFEGTKRLQGPAEARDVQRALGLLQRLSRAAAWADLLEPASPDDPFLASKVDGVCRAVAALECRTMRLGGSGLGP
jgi:hypothetical protein